MAGEVETYTVDLAGVGALCVAGFHDGRRSYETFAFLPYDDISPPYVGGRLGRRIRRGLRNIGEKIVESKALKSLANIGIQAGAAYAASTGVVPPEVLGPLTQAGQSLINGDLRGAADASAQAAQEAAQTAFREGVASAPPETAAALEAASEALGVARGRTAQVAQATRALGQAGPSVLQLAAEQLAGQPRVSRALTQADTRLTLARAIADDREITDRAARRIIARIMT